MARITHVKKAQQRYVQVPVIDPATGEQKRTPVMRNGEQRKTKHGRPIFLSVTKDDKDQPLPSLTCEKCSTEIKVGDPYKHVTPKSGPYGGRKRVRCAACPSWQVWDLSQSLSARVAQIAHEGRAQLDQAETKDDVESALQGIAEEVRSLAEEKREGATNIEDGFGHETSQSQELNDIADQLDSWADDIESAQIPDDPEPEEDDCDECEGRGRFEPDSDHDYDEDDLDENGEIECENCNGTGQATPDEPTDDQQADWRQEVEDAANVLDECPV